MSLIVVTDNENIVVGGGINNRTIKYTHKLQTHTHSHVGLSNVSGADCKKRCKLKKIVVPHPPACAN